MPEPERTVRRRSLLQRLFLANAAVLVVAALLLIFTPVTIDAPVTLEQLALIIGAVAAMLIATFVLLRKSLAPLHELTALMRTIDPLEPGRRLTGVAHADAEVATLVESFNAMLDRLEQERRSSGRRALAAQEEERRRIARELHDGIGQTLTGVAMQAERTATAPPDELRAAMQEIPDAIRSSIDDVRRISRELRPEALDDLGLANALLILCRRMGRHTGVRVEPDLDLANGLPHLPPETELVLYRVAQEGLTNAVRHAQATTITLSLRVAAGRIALRVRDDGRGIEAPLAGESVGISGMRERALLIGAQLEIRSGHGAGTEVRLDAPIVREAP